MKTPSLLPVYYQATGVLEDGASVKASSFCRDRLSSGDVACAKHYASLTASSGFRACPHGFTSLPLKFRGELVVVTGVVATPRFNTTKERERAKKYPDIRVSRDSMLATAHFFKEVESALAGLEEEARKRLPQALHELRKLNAIVKASAEKLSEQDAQSQEIRDLAGAAELMSNIFEVVEALANVDGLKQLKRDEYIAAYDLAFKAKKIYQVRARLKPIHISVNGDHEVGILGSKKTFPIVLTVLLENAIKYGRRDSTINIEVRRDGLDCVLEVSNRTDYVIDPASCFDRGVRFGDGSSEGSGLGLYLAREVVASHGGNIRCEISGDLVTMRVAVPAHTSQRARG